jgi:hypothetical protein
MNTRHGLWAVVNRATNEVTQAINPADEVPFFALPAVFKSRRLARNYIRLMTCYCMGFEKSVKVERCSIVGGR